MKEKLFTIPKSAFEFQAFMASGPGGQKRNKTASAIRVIHKESGISETCSEHRSQHANKLEALRKLSKNKMFKAWIHGKITGIEAKVDEEMKKVLVEVFDTEKNEWQIYKN